MKVNRKNLRVTMQFVFLKKNPKCGSWQVTWTGYPVEKLILTGFLTKSGNRGNPVTS